jgi:hypothetical protein
MSGDLEELSRDGTIKDHAKSSSNPKGHKSISFATVGRTNKIGDVN